jgi:hypothetical protein
MKVLLLSVQRAMPSLPQKLVILLRVVVWSSSWWWWMSQQQIHVCVALGLGTPMLPRVDRRTCVEKIVTGSAVVGCGSILSTPYVAHAATTTQTNQPQPQQVVLVPPLSQRLDATLLKQPPTTPTSVATSAGIDNTVYPDFLQGTWRVQQTLVNVTTPLGLPYIGGPNGDVSIAQKSIMETQSKFGQPVSLQLRFVKTKWGVVEDRLYNNAQRLNAFAGRTVVATVDYANVGASNRNAILQNGGTMEDPLQTVLIKYKGPAAQKIFVTSHSSTTTTTTTTTLENSVTGGGSSTKHYVSEGQRSIFALTNENTSPPIFTDTETLYEFVATPTTESSLPPKMVTARLRLVGYLNAQQDKLYFDARNRAVSLLDYTLEMERIL